MIAKRLNDLRKVMADNGLDAYIIPTGDDHMSEYLCDYFKEREFISGFTGSAGMVMVTKDEADLWVDGRYHLQSENETKGTEYKIFKEGLKGVKNINEQIDDVFAGKEATIGVCGRFVAAAWGEAMKESLIKRGITLKVTDDIMDGIWEERPGFPKTEIFNVPLEYVGESAESKLSKVREVLDDDETMVINALDEVAWVLNVRGFDIADSLMKLAFLIITKKECKLYINGSEDISAETAAYFDGIGVTVLPYDKFYEDLACVKGLVSADKKKINYAIYDMLLSNGCTLSKHQCPIKDLKIVKNPTEVQNLIDVHITDGVAMTKFIYWVKQNAGNITEIEASDYLEKLRRASEGNLGLSFGTISAYADHGAIVHYHATPESNAHIKKEGLLLVDSGGQYYKGTTDITRTIAMGPVTDEMKKCYTLVLKGAIRLANVKFPRGVDGLLLDAIARGPLWEHGMDYIHGTGHGIGYMLNVHEDPVRISMLLPRMKTFEFTEGVVTSDEPGVYLTGKFGIRIENQLVCESKGQGMYKDMLGFRILTCVPLEADCIDKSLLNSEDIERINNYHAWVYEMLSDKLSEEERDWLKDVTKPI